MTSEQELSVLLPNVEKHIFKQAVFAVYDDDVAPDIVQDTMIKLAEKHDDEPGVGLSLPFQCILQSAIHDWSHRTKVRNTWASLLSSFRSDVEGDDTDPSELIESEVDTTAAESSADKVERLQMFEILEHEIEKLPTRQRKASLMRYWEDMDVAEMARTADCFEGGVKTHCSWATHALAQVLRAQRVRL